MQIQSFPVIPLLLPDPLSLNWRARIPEKPGSSNASLLVVHAHAITTDIRCHGVPAQRKRLDYGAERGSLAHDHKRKFNHRSIGVIDGRGPRAVGVHMIGPGFALKTSGLWNSIDHDEIDLREFPIAVEIRHRNAVLGEHHARPWQNLAGDGLAIFACQ